jgi:hypothetical protein
MGCVFRKTVTRPLPPGAEIVDRKGVRLARWRDARGKAKTAPVATGKDGAERIRDESSTYFARYRDGNTVAQLALEGRVAHIELDAADEKNREGNGVVVRADLAEDLKHWLADKLAAMQAEARGRGEPIPARLPGETPLFYIPDKLSKIFHRDLRAAGIPKRDERGRTLDVHALRTTFGTLLGRGGVPLRTTQAAMRHADPSLTANVYTDPKLLDVHGALDALPSLPLDSGQTPIQVRARATGTDTYGRSSVALSVALTPDSRGEIGSNAVKTNAEPPNSFGPARLAVSDQTVKGREALIIADKATSEWAIQDLNL